MQSSVHILLKALLLTGLLRPPAIWSQDARDIFYSGAPLSGHARPAGAHRLDGPLGLRYAILKQSDPDDPDEFVEVKPDEEFHAGDRVRISVTANRAGYFYIITQGSSGEWRALFPDPSINDGRNSIEAGKMYDVPGGPEEAFIFDQQPGSERIFVLLTVTPEKDLDATMASLQKGGVKAQTKVNELREQTRQFVFEKQTVDDDHDKSAYVVNKCDAPADQPVWCDVILKHVSGAAQKDN